MGINTGAKIGWFLIGLGIGIIGTKIVMEKAFEDKLEELDREWDANVDSIRKADDGVETESPAEGRRLSLVKDRYKRMAKNYSTDRSNPVIDKDELEPYLINVQQFSEEQNDYQKLTVYYYAGDNILLSDDDEVLSDDEHSIGNNVSSLFDEDEHVVYIRNEMTETDYEVIYLNESHSEPVSREEY